MVRVARVVGGEDGGHLGDAGGDGFVGLVGEVAAGIGEVDLAGAAVGGVRDPGDERPAFEAVDHVGEGRPLDARVRLRSVMPCGAVEQDADQVRLLRGEAERAAGLGVQVLEEVHQLCTRAPGSAR